ncbi:D-ribose pyranase [Rhizobacter sp. SG703]|uniref:D-ribose pyranase n=1 Tax=Rhizobacter sp. SG703 TaxID=2587140 RepID=UPI001446C738|nr:D-ribose pyranase [Rhizobacter sp. SG703]
MKKTALLHVGLSQLVAGLGHGDLVVIADAGLPVPAGTPCIDLALTRGVPSFDQVLQALLSEMQVERAALAEEALQRSPAFVAQAGERLPGVPVERLSHDELKRRSASARAIVRTGEFTPYANLLLYAGVVF